MERDSETISYLKHGAKTVRLSSAEREHLVNHIISSPYIFHSHYWTPKKLVGVIVILLLALTGGGASIAAAGSLPGDALYGMKVNVNEEVQSFIAISPDAKAKVEAGRVKERLSEAEQLSIKGKLNSETQIIIKHNLKRHTENVKENVSILASEQKSDEANRVIDDLKSSLDQHEATLESLSFAQVDVTASSSKESDHLGAIINSVIETKAEMETIQKSFDATSTSSSNVTASSTSSSNASSTSTVIDINASTTASTTITKEENKNFLPRKKTNELSTNPSLQ